MVTSSIVNSLRPELFTSVDLIEGPTVEPIDLDEFKRHIRFNPTSEDTLIDTYIAMARQYFEMETGRQLIAATWELRLEGFPVGDVIELPRPPLIEVVSVTYPGSGGSPDGELLDPDDFEVVAPSGPYARRGRIRPVSSWPSVTNALDAIKIRFRAGYGEQPGEVPTLVRGALLYLAGHYHQHRTQIQDQRNGNLISLPLGAEAIMRQFKYTAFASLPPMRGGVATTV